MVRVEVGDTKKPKVQGVNADVTSILGPEEPSDKVCVRALTDHSRHYETRRDLVLFMIEHRLAVYHDQCFILVFARQRLA